MRKLLPVLLLFSMPLWGQESLQSLINAEKAFASHADSLGIKAAFVTYLGDSGMIFTPRPTLGKAHYQALPEPNGKLYWHPTYAVVSAGGDIGFTTGPFVFKPDEADSSSWRWGHFTSVWQKQADGSWKNIADFGSPHAAPSAKTPIAYPASYALAPSKKKAGKGSRASLLETDTSPADYNTYFTPGTALYREGQCPRFEKAHEQAVQENQRYTLWQPLHAAIGEAGDFGYTYGQYCTNKGTKGYYLRIWQMQRRGWTVLLESLNQEK
ncbi:hypothetical protein D770_15180 [Flammeovirgaceae bacterium 311]|nr:hypothetical protein D770_15180 [Flammeovirgaceae bacterium 311]